MEGDQTTATESDVTYFDQDQAQLTEYGEDFNEYGIYYGSDSMYDTIIDGGNQLPGSIENQSSQQIRQFMSQLNTSQSDLSGSELLHSVHKSASGHSDISDSCEEVLDEERASGSESSIDLASTASTDEHVSIQYQKLPCKPGGNEFMWQQVSNSLDRIMLHRLPEENLGMSLGIEVGKHGDKNVTSVSVKSVTFGGAAYRATGIGKQEAVMATGSGQQEVVNATRSSKGLCVGDEIVEVNGLDLRTLSRDECTQVLKDMPLKVLIGIKRGQIDFPSISISPFPCDTDNARHLTENINANIKSVQINKSQDISNDNNSFEGFAEFKVTVRKKAEDNLGLSITPSYGSTKEYYQIKRILPSRAAAQTGKLKVGDRLISCNGVSLRALTQKHCLDIIKSLSSIGDIEFEVIRPVYNGSPMETFLTVSSNGNIEFEPHECTLKSQSLEKDKIDIVAKSEINDYLTVSEDEYSQCAKLANSGIEANQAFVADVEANQSTVSNILEKTNTETDSENIGTDLENSNSGSAQIVDFNEVVTSSYHFSHDRDIKVDLSSFQNFQKPLIKASPFDKTDIDPFKELPGYHIPTPISVCAIDKDSVLLSSSNFSGGSSNLAKAELHSNDADQVIPHLSILDYINSDPVNCVSSTYFEQINARTSCSSESDTCEINLPNNYTQENFEGLQSVHDTEDVRYNEILEDINLNEFTDSEIPDDTYVASLQANYIKTSLENYNNLQKSSIDIFEDKKCCVLTDVIESNEEKVNETVTVSPSVEFLEYQTNLEITENQEVAFIELPVANIDDTDIESSIAQKDFTDISSTKLSNNCHEFNLESILQDFEQDSTIKIKNFTHLNEDDELAFSSELAAPFDIVLQEQGIIDQIEQFDPIDYYEINESDNLHVVTGCVTNQFETEKTKPLSASPVYYETQFQLPGNFSESIMDDNSESMLEKTLNIEFENLSEFKMHETKLKLGEHVIADVHDMDRENNENYNVVAENIAKEINQNEKGNYGYIVKCDDEPDMFPEQCVPEQAPEQVQEQVPERAQEQSDAAPLNFSNNGDMLLNYDSNDLFTDDLKEDENERIFEKDTDMDNDAIHIDLNIGHAQTIGENDVHVVPVKTENTVNLKIEHEQENINDAILPVNMERKLEFPSHFDMIEIQFDAKNCSESKAVNVIKKISPPPVLPKPRKSLIKIDNSERKTEENFSKAEHIVEDIIIPVEVKRSTFNALGNVINAVNAFKVGSADFKVAEIEKGTRVNAIKDHYNSAINFSEIRKTETFPPKYEQEVVFREKISMSKNLDREVLPHRKDIIEIETNVIEKPKELVPTKHQSVLAKLHRLKTESSQAGYVPITKTNDDGGPKIFDAGRPKENILKYDFAKQTSKENPSVSHGVVPPLNLETYTNTDISNTSSQDDYSKERSSTTYKMTTVESKQDSLEPTFQMKSQITPLSFNPKSLSQSSTRPALSQSNMRPLLFSTLTSYSGKQSVSKPGTGILKADHPIKRMESMPFEVSILKGILGIGIKTSMTPEGCVQVTEILPNGPVGREGNIIVGDYILSINGTELTGQTDGKVQQILRLLPRGLSKIVASAIPPNPSIEKVHVAVETEKLYLTPRQSLTYSTRQIQKQSSLSSHWPLATSTTTDHVSETKVPLKFSNSPSSLEYIQSSKNISKLPLQSPVPSPRPNFSSPRSYKTLSDSPMSPPGSPMKLLDSPMPSPRSPKQLSDSPLQSPRSPKKLSDSPMPSPRSHFGSENSHSSKVEQYFNLHTITSKLPSLQQTGSQQTGSQQNITKIPPPVAPKPKRVHEKLVESKIDGKETLIEIALIVPNKASNVECELEVKDNSEFLPGLVTYDSMNLTNTTSGMESLIDITVDVNEKKGVVNTYEELSDVHTTNKKMTSDKLLADIIIDDVKDKDVVINTHEELSDVNTSYTVVSDFVGNDDKSTAVGHDTFCLEAIDSCNKLDIFQLQTDDSFSENKPDKISTSRTSDIKCSEEEIIPENIKEKEVHAKQIYTDNLESNLKVNNKDIVKSNSETDQKESDAYEQLLSSPDMDSFDAMAINIVADVIKSVQKLDLSNHEPDPNEIFQSLTEEIPFLRNEDPLISINSPPNLDIVSNHDETPPPLPYSDVPTFNPIHGAVNDLALYPDNGEESREQMSKIKHDQKGVIDIGTASVEVSLQATTPFTDTNFSKNENYKCKSSLSQAKEELSIQEIDDAVDNTEAGDQIINNVISLYSNIEKSFDSDSSETNIFQKNNDGELKESNEDTKNILAYVEENMSCDTTCKSISSSEDIINDHDNGEEVELVGNGGSDNLSANTNYPHPHNILPPTVSVHFDLENAALDCNNDNHQESLQTKSELKPISRVDNTDELQGEKSSKEMHRLIQTQSPSGLPESNEGSKITITMNKGVTGLGFVIQGGKCSPKGDLPISIKRIFKGGPAEGHLQEMDEILEVNGEDMSNMRQTEAWNHLKFLSSGNVVMKIRRHSTQEAD